VSERLFGAHVRRREDPRLITGGGRYVADVALPRLLHLAVHRSLHAHARLVSIDTQGARRHPGVVHTLVPAEVAALGRLPLLVPHQSLLAPICAEVLPQEIVSYVWQPIALVVAGRETSRPASRSGWVTRRAPWPGPR
jgi:carbon-monoxide dehydrogenase large subunit